MSRAMSALELEDPEFRASISRIRSYATSIMKDSIDVYFTDHGEGHLTRVLLLIDRILIQNDKANELTDAERYVLLASTYLHDIGMQAEKSVSDNAERRREHHKIAHDLIISKWKDMGVLEGYASAIARVAMGHRGSSGKDLNSETIGTAQCVRLDLLGSLLFLADELEISYERVTPPKLDFLNYPLDSLLHIYRHYYTQGVDVLESRCLSIAFRYPRGRIDQYHPHFGAKVVRKLSEAIKQCTPILQERYGITLVIRDQDIKVAEDAALASVDPAQFAAMVSSSLGIPNYNRIEARSFDDMAGDPQEDLFFQGDIRWENIVNDLDIRRAQYQEINSALSSLFKASCAKHCLTGLLICGEGGSGKTTVLMRLAYDCLQSSSYSNLNLLWLPHDSHFDFKQLAQLYYATQQPILLFVDGIGIYQIVELMKNQISPDTALTIPLVVILATRLNEWDGAEGASIPFQAFEQIQLEPLVDSEIEGLLAKLEKHGKLGALDPLSTGERFAVFREKSDRQLLVAMLEATQGRGFTEIIHDEYRNLRQQHFEAARAYEYICLFYLYDVLLPRELLITLAQCSDYSNFLQKVLKFTRLVIVAHPDSRFGIKYRPRHHAIASVLVSRLPEYQGIGNRLQKAALVLRAVAADEKQERYVMINFCQNLITDLKYGPSDQYVDSLYTIREFFRTHIGRIWRLQKAARDESSIAELILWSRVYAELGLKSERIVIQRMIVQLDSQDKNAHYHLARLLSQTQEGKASPEIVADQYLESYKCGNRRIKFLYEFLLFCLKYKLYNHLEPIIDSFFDFVSYSHEEDDLKRHIKTLIEGYRIERDQEKLAIGFASLEKHIRTTSGLSAADELAYIDLLESRDPAQTLKDYETFLLTKRPARAKGHLLRIARLASKVRGQDAKALNYYREIYETHIKSNPQMSDYEIIYDYALLCVKVEPLPKERVYSLLKECIRLKDNELKAYYHLASFAASQRDSEMACAIAVQGVESARHYNLYTSRWARDLKQLAADLGR